MTNREKRWVLWLVLQPREEVLEAAPGPHLPLPYPAPSLSLSLNQSLSSPRVPWGNLLSSTPVSRPSSFPSS